MFETDMYVVNYIQQNMEYYKKLECYAAMAKYNSSDINELHNIMNFTKITNNDSAHAAIRGNNYIVGSITNGVVSMASNPAVHYGADTARTECKRLARLNPGVTYFFTQLKGAELVPTMSVSI